MNPASGAETEVRIPAGAVVLEGILTLPEAARQVVLFVHGSGSSRHSPRNRFVARTLNRAGLATLLFDLLTPEEESADALTGEYRFDIGLLADRLGWATEWVLEKQGKLGVGYFGSSTGGAAALVAAAERPGKIAAVVCRGSRTDMASGVLGGVSAPTLLIVGGEDRRVLAWNRESYAALACEKQLAIVPGATHLFEEPGALEQVAELAAEWFRSHGGRQCEALASP